MDISEKIPSGFNELALERRKKWIKDKNLDWRLCDPNLKGSMHGLIENHIGQISIPLGLAGPLKIEGAYAKGTFYVPLATLEGTLALSMTRGLITTSLSGGIKTQHVKQELSRSPIFSFDSFENKMFFSKWIVDNFKSIKSIAEKETNFGRLLRIEQYHIHEHLILDFVYTTGEAAGQNMTTFCTFAACEFIKHSLSDKFNLSYLIECNFNSDKNASSKTLIQTRGHSVISSCIISNEICQKVLGCTTKEMADSWNFGRYGNTLANCVGLNLHNANALSAIYLATGQDCACVAENSCGIVDFIYSQETKNLKCILTMPSISVGTVGGGTLLPQQQANLKLLNCLGKDSSKKLAEIICASSLALEISLGAAITNNSFTRAHKIFGRKKERTSVTI